MEITIGIADDHQLFLESLVALLESNNKFKVILKALNGKDLQMKMEGKNILPDIMLLDVNMPQLDGIQTATWLKSKYPQLKLVALSMKDDEVTIIKMLKAGCCSYLLKDIHPDELEKALQAVYTKGYYNSEKNHINFSKLLNIEIDLETMKLSERELEFLQLACNDITYKEISNMMNVSERMIESIREKLYVKFNVQGRVGLCMEALKRELVKI